jgi:subtilisin-like proprotein convertase family protein
MFRSSRFLALVAVALGLAIALLTPHGQDISANQQQAPEPRVGRYQVFKSQNFTDDCLLDTATGMVWRLQKDGLRGAWNLAVDGPK